MHCLIDREELIQRKSNDGHGTPKAKSLQLTIDKMEVWDGGWRQQSKSLT